MGERPRALTADRPRVLLVDDGPRFRRELREVLTDYGVAVVAEAASGHEAVELARRVLPEVVLMDLRMPGLDGITATRLLREALPAAQVILLSAYDDPALVTEARRAGAYTYLAKGCPVRHIVEVIGQAAAAPAGRRRAARARPAEATPPGHAGG